MLRRSLLPIDWKTAGTAIVLFASTVVLYVPALDGEFVYDDVPQIVVDGFVHDPAKLLQVVSLQVLGEDIIDNNRPVMIASLMLDSLVWQGEPFGYHLTSVLLHAGCVLLTFLLLNRLLASTCINAETATSDVVAAALGATLLMLHPVCTEAVAAITFREDLLATFFTLAGLFTAAGLPVTSGTMRLVARIACASFCFLLAVGSKETGVAGPVALVPMAACLASRGTRGRWVAQTAVAASVVGAFLTARFWFAPRASVVFAYPPQRLGGSAAEWLAIQSPIWALDVQQLVWPRWLCADYSESAVAHLSGAGGIAMVVLFAAVLLLAAWRVRGAAIGAALFVAGLLPASNVLPMYCPAADRYLYLPIAGLAIVGGVVLAAIFGRCGKIIRLVTLVAIVAAYSVLGRLAVERQRVWHDAQSLWTATLNVHPTSVVADLGLGVDWLNRGEPQQALEHLQRAIEHSGGPSGELLAITASCVEELGQPQIAEMMLREALRLDARLETPELAQRGLFWRPAAIARLRPVASRLGLEAWVAIARDHDSVP